MMLKISERFLKANTELFIVHKDAIDILAVIHGVQQLPPEL